MKSNFVNDVRNVETQSQTAVENWRAQEGSRIRAVYPLPDSTVKMGEPEGWRHRSRHIEIAVADGLPFFALVESERVTDSPGRVDCIVVQPQRIVVHQIGSCSLRQTIDFALTVPLTAVGC